MREPVAADAALPPRRRFALDVSNVNQASEAIVRASGCAVLICKATEGSNYDDRTLAAHRAIAKKVGIPFGSYLFLHAQSPGDEAKNYLRYAKPGPNEIVIIDAEPGGQDKATIRQMAQRADSCARELESRGYDPILYASSSYWRLLVDAVPGLKRLRVWEAQYPGRFTRWFPAIAQMRERLGRGATVVMWQWTDRFAVNGRYFDMSLIFVAPDKLARRST